MPVNINTFYSEKIRQGTRPSNPSFVTGEEPPVLNPPGALVVRENFTDLNDTPNTYSGQGGKNVAVKVDESGLEFVDGEISSSNYLIITFDDIVNVPVSNANSVSDWNTFFDLPTFGNPFTSVEVVGNEVKLIGGSDIEIKEGLMYTNTYLISIYDNGTIKKIGADAFSYSDNLISVFSNSCLEILDAPSIINDSGAFGYCPNLETINFQNIRYIGKIAFESCVNLFELKIENVRVIGEVSFDNCQSIESIYFPILVKTLDNSFQSCSSLVNVYLPSLVETSGLFSGCSSLVNVYLPSLVNAGINIFNNCSNLEVVDLPNVNFIGQASFESCNSLNKIKIPNIVQLGETVGDNGVFVGITSNNIELWIRKSLMTINGGNPDGDIQYLQANNTVTVIEL
jgi:hypothetical protein